MPITKADYKLIISSNDITISKIKIGDKSKQGADLQADYNPTTRTFEGTIEEIYCDCSSVFVNIEGDGPVGGNTKLSVTICATKKLKNQPIKKEESNGIYSYSETIQLV